MNAKSTCSFLLLFTTTLYLTAADDQSPGPSLIAKACELAPDRAFCKEILKSHPDGNKSNLKQLAFIALQTASKKAAETSVNIKKLQLDDDDDDGAADSNVQQGLDDCSEGYSSIVDQINDAIDALVTGNNNDVETEMNAAIDAADTCAAAIKSLEGQALEVSQQNRNVRQLCENALSVIRVSEKQH